MYFLQYRVIPGAAHPKRERLGEGLVCCWIDRDSLQEADRVARRSIQRRKWEVLECECGEPTTEEDYDEEVEGLQHYRQALTDKEVFAYHLSPRYPVYWVSASVSREGNTAAAEAHYFLAGDSILQEGEDLYDPSFWSGEPGQVALDAAAEAISEAGWSVTAMAQKRPCGRGDVPEELVPYYDEAESSGSCLVFLHEGEDQAEPDDLNQSG